MYDYAKSLVDKIDLGISLSENELSDIVWEAVSGMEIVSEEEEGHGRWRRGVVTIIKYEDRYFSIYWAKGLTENCDSDYPEQPVEVIRNEYEKTITVVEWNEKI